MKPTLALFRNDRLFWLLFLLIGGFMLWGARLVPFHPDESTYLYMSSDFEVLFEKPASLAWNSAQENNPRQLYRLLNPPLTHYVLGMGRALSNLHPLPIDWDWSKSWEENRQAGALPEERLLLAGRVAVTLCLLLGLFFLYRAGKQLGGQWTGILTVLLMGSNMLVLLHGRRAMSEGLLIFGICIFLWSLAHSARYPWLAALGLFLAFNAKPSTLALLPVGFLAVCWNDKHKAKSLKNWLCARGLALTQFSVVFILLTWIVNPVLWKNPLHAARAAINARRDLVSRQVSEISIQGLDSPVLRAAMLVANLTILPPAFAEVGNYLSETAGQEQAYLAIFGHNLLRGWVGGGILLSLTLLGLVGIVSRIISSQSSQVNLNRRNELLLLLTGLFQTVGLVVAVPLPWQRYCLPLVPLICLLAALGLVELSQRLVKPKRRYPKYSRNLRRTAG